MARVTDEQLSPEPDLDDVGTDGGDAAPDAELVDIEDGLGTDVAVDDNAAEADADTGDDDEPAVEEAEALAELEAEELEMLTDDEASEVMPVGQAELQALRREQMATEADAEGVGSDEFVCQSCFLVKRTSQIADTRKKICRDCAG